MNSTLELIPGMTEVINHIKNLEAENKKIKGEAKMFSETFKKEIKELKEDYEKNKQASAHLEEDGKVWDNAEEEWVDEEDVDKYNDDDWSPGYGFTVKDGEYRICMAGGGNHWYDYVMTKNGCFIHSTDGMKKVFTFVSCPEGNYIKVWDTPHMDGGLTLGEGETDMYEMVKECFQEEIMDYVDEEDCIPDGSDEEPDSP